MKKEDVLKQLDQLREEWLTANREDRMIIERRAKLLKMSLKTDASYDLAKKIFNV